MQARRFSVAGRKTGASFAAISVLAFATVLSLSGCSDDDGAKGKKVLHFSAIPDQDETRLRAKYKPVADWLSKELGVPVEYVHCTNYADAVDHFKNGDVQLAWFGGLTGVQARHAVSGARAIAQGVEDPDFYSYFIANASTGLERSDEFPAGIAGHSFTFGAADSTSGRLMPEHFIRQHLGQAPATAFGHPDAFSNSHDKTCELVEAGQFEAGAVNYTVYDRRVAEGKTDPNVCRVIWQTPRYADYNFTAHPSLDETYGGGFTDKVQAALLRMKDKALLDAFPRTGFIAATNEDFAVIDELAHELGFVR